jgi:hypothetical protein
VAAAGELGEWARRQGVEVEFDAREISIAGYRTRTIFVLFTAR